MNTTTQETTTTNETAQAQAPTLKKWEVGAGLGPRMAKVFNDALRNASFNSRGVATINGIIGKPETERGRDMVMVAMFGGATNPAYEGKLIELQAKHGNQVTQANYKALSEDLQGLAHWLHHNPIIKDERVTQEEHDAKEAKYQAAIAKQNEERKARENSHASGLAKAKASYPWAQQSGSSQARGAANLKTLLGIKFPGVVFGCRSSSASMTCSIDVSWKDGPTEAEVKAYSDQFQYADFDGMTDMSNNRETGEGFRSWMGSAKWVSENRDVVEAIATVKAALLAIEPHPQEWENPNDYGHHSLSAVAGRIVGKTSLKAGEKITGVTRKDDVMAGNHEDCYNVTIEASAVPQAPAPVAGESGIVAKLNTEKGGVEIKFPGKPEQSMIERVKAHGFRWSRFSGVWWAKDRPAAREFAFGLAGASVPTEEAHSPAESVRDPGEDVADRWAEQQHGLACNA